MISGYQRATLTPWLSIEPTTQEITPYQWVHPDEAR
jgi:hypothetical protein